MGKKQKDETPNVNLTPNRDIIQRLNFLYQASVYLQSIEPPIPAPDTSASKSHPRSVKSRSKGRRKAKESQVTDTTNHAGDFCGKKRGTSRLKVRMNQTTGDLARDYIRCMRVVGQKTTVKIDPALKRSICSSCNTTLVLGSSASARVKKCSSHGHLVIYTCLNCKTSKSIPAPPTLPIAAGAEEFEGSFNPPPVIPGASEPSNTLNPFTTGPPVQLQVQQDKKGKKSIVSSLPRLLPLFARPDVGHAVFKGSEAVILDQEGGSGVCFV